VAFRIAISIKLYKEGKGREKKGVHKKGRKKRREEKGLA
jgi:hypothetical protein